MDPSADHHEYCTGGFKPNDIVISGMAGRFPDCDNVGELQEGLYQKKSLIRFTDERYEKGTMNIPYQSCGLVKNLDKLDADYFCCTYHTAHGMDPSTRIHLEVSYEAIADSGYNPSELKGCNIGVYNATTGDDAQRIRINTGYAVNLNCIRTMVPNRTSFAFDFTGPSYTVDAACSSSAICLWTAMNDIRDGRVDSALVSGCQLNLTPDLHTAYFMSGIASLSGNSIPFDASSDGMLRTEAITALFLQPARLARRAYATIAISKFLTSGHVPEGISVPSMLMEIRLMKETLEEAGVSPNEIDYVEAHGTGTTVGDPIELNALAETFCQNRDKPLYVGTIKSNIGHTEASSGTSGMIKAIITFENGLIPPNILYEVPNPAAPALLDGRLVVVTEPTPFTSKYIPVSSFGFGGTLVETLLKINPITYENRKPIERGSLPKLVLYPATSEAGILHVFDYIKNNFPKLHEEFYALLHKLSYTSPFLKSFRGYAIFKDEENPAPLIKQVGTNKRQLWYVMTGMGCQWSGMGLQLMKIDVFAKSMRKSAQILKSYGIDLFELLRADKDYLNVNRSITPAFVSISAIQVALVDLLRYIDVNPDGIVGHSTGELVCAYADGCCTHEQTILSAYWRGKSVESANLQSGGMAAVGLSWKDGQRLCPEGIFAACDNADDSITISGLKEPIETFVAKLQSENIFARVVNAYGYAFHCKYVHGAAATLKQALEKLITDPKPRSERWVSSSFPESEWEKPECKVATAEYFVHNLMSRVLFNDALKKIPKDAIVVEIGPHFLLHSILKRVIGSDASYIGLMKRNEKDNATFFLESMGKLYNEGVDVRIDRLYPAVKFPVPRGTPMLSDLIKWNHTQSFYVPKYAPSTSEFSRYIKADKEDAYLLDHRIDGRSLFPATGYICLAWEAFAGKSQRNFLDIPVVIENFKIHRATILGPQIDTMFYVNILDSTGHFEVTEGRSLVASGDIRECKKMVFEEEPPTYKCDDYSAVSGKDIYNELKMSGYEYGPAFQGLIETNMEGTNGLVLWREKWISYLDSLLLFFGMINRSNDFFLPTGALSFKIDPNDLKGCITPSADIYNTGEQAVITQNFPVTYNPKTRICRSVGVEISNLNVDAAPHRGKDDSPTLEQYMFVPYLSKFAPTDDTKVQLSHYMGVCNVMMDKIGKAAKKDLKPYKFPVENIEDLCVEEFLENLSEEHVLLSTLLQISEKFSSMETKKNEWFSAYSRTSGKDLLNSSMINEESLRIMLEIISENTYRKLSVVELNRNFPIILTNAIEMLQKYSHMKFKKNSLVAPKNFVVDKDALDEHGIQLLTEDSLVAMAEEKSQDVAISSFTCGTFSELQNLVQSLNSVVKSNGFILLFYKENISCGEKLLSSLCGEEHQVQSYAALEKALQEQKLTILSKISDSFGGSVCLLRTSSEPAPHKVLYIEESSYGWVEELKKELYKKDDKETKETGLIWLVSQDSPINGIIGMVNCLKQEPGGERIRCVFISQKNKTAKVPSFNFENSFYKHLQEKSLIMNVWKEGSWGSFRHIVIRETKVLRNVDHSYIHCRKYGDLSTFEWIESQVKYADLTCQKLVHIYYSALNFRDVMLATGKLSVGTAKDIAQGDESVLGLEFCGRDETGKRVCGFVKSRGMATSTLVEPIQMIDVPDNWTLEEAATVPVVYCTCYYALIMRAKLREGEKILIHSGTGGIGMAAINLALSMNCEIFTTVGNDDKRKYLKKQFPQLKDENIGCSRNVTFSNMIMNRTNGEGVDVVLNSLADDKFQASLRCVAKSGRFVEIGKYDLALDRQIGLKMFLMNISFHAVFLDQLFEKKPSTLRDLDEIMSLLKDGIKKGVVKPLDRTVFGRNDIEEAFRYMAKGVHVGKVLLKIRDEEPQKGISPKMLMLPAVPNTYFYANKVYIIIGGLGGFGIEVTKWIIRRGGKNIILTSRYGERTPYHYLCLRRWKKEGANVFVSTMNVEHKRDAEKLLQEEANRIGPVGGIFNSAVVLKDSFMDCQSAEDYREVCAPKAIASKNLDELSRKLCPSLDYFVCFSSISCGRGNAGQTNYGYANSVMERICEERRSDGLHGLSIQWGIIGEVGVVHRHMGDDAMIAGVMAQSVKSCLETMDAFCQQTAPVVTSYVTAAAVKKSGQGDILTQIVKILGMNDISEINTTRSFGEMGIDSMVGVEMKQLIESYCDMTISMQEIQEMKIDDVKSLFAKADTERTSTVPALLATTVVKLPQSLLHTDPLVVLNKDETGTPIFIVNLGDTEVKDFKTLAEIVGRPVYALIWTKDAPTTDIQSIASWYLKLIQNTVGGPFHVIGHSLGGSVAFEMAIQSEKTDKNLKTLTLISGADDLINSQSKEETESGDPEVTALCRFVSQFVAGGSNKLEEELNKVPNLEQRIRTVLNFLTSSSSQTVNKNEVADAISIHLEKFNLIQSYIPSEKLTKDINLIEDPTLLLANDVTVLKELFAQICNGKVTIHRVFSYSQLSNKEDVERVLTVLQTII